MKTMGGSYHDLAALAAAEFSDARQSYKASPLGAVQSASAQSLDSSLGKSRWGSAASSGIVTASTGHVCSDHANRDAHLGTFTTRLVTEQLPCAHTIVCLSPVSNNSMPWPSILCLPPPPAAVAAVAARVVNRQARVYSPWNLRPHGSDSVGRT